MKDRLLNILIATFVILLALNLFLPKPAKLVETNEPTFSLSKTSVVIPNYPKVEFKNPTSSAITFDTCKDLVILKDLKTVIIDDQSKNFCQSLSIQPGASHAIDLSAISPLFTQPGNVGFKLTLAGKEITSTIAVEDRSSIRAFLATIFYAPILNAFVALIHYLPNHSLGLAIIIITIIVRLILLFPQHQMLVSARKMQEIQPKIKALQEKFKGDQAKMGMELMELYKREKVNPLGSCLPLLIQTPILIVLYWVLTSIQDHSNYYYLYSVFQSFNVSQINHIFAGVDLLSIGGVAGYVLAIVVAFTQFSQIWLSQRRQGKPSKDTTPIVRDPNSLMPDPELMNKFMLWILPVVIGISTVYFPIGVGVYWFIGTLFMLVQQAVANKVADRKYDTAELILAKKSKKVKQETVIEG